MKVHKNAVPNVQKSAVVNLQNSAIGNNKKSPVANVQKSEKVNVQKCAITNVQKSAVANVQKSAVVNVQKSAVCMACHQGKVSKKFKDKQKFITLVKKLGIHKTTKIFKINVYKLCERHPKLLKSSIGLGFLKNHYKDIKEICSENAQEFS